jgi:hypothetical protein
LIDFVSPVARAALHKGRDEEMIRTYIENQEIADKQLDQLQLYQNPL